MPPSKTKFKTWYKIYIERPGHIDPQRTHVATVRSPGLCQLTIQHYEKIYLASDGWIVSAE